MSGSLRRHRLRCKEDISGQFRVILPDAGELDQLRTRGGCIGRDCIPLVIGIMNPLNELSPYQDPRENPLWSPWTQMMLDGPRRKSTIE